MKKPFGSTLKLLAVVIAMTASAAASAQSAGTWSVKGGVYKITPRVESGNLSAPALPETKGDVMADTQPILSASYMLTDNIALESFVSFPFKHELHGAGAIEGTGKIGTSETLPATLFVQYRFFEAKSKIRPYLGLGLTYAYFLKETGSGKMTALTNPGGPPTTFKMDNKFAWTPQIGVAFSFNEKWFADLSVSKTYLKTTAHFSTNQSQDITLNPVSVGVAVGYRF